MDDRLRWGLYAIQWTALFIGWRLYLRKRPETSTERTRISRWAKPTRLPSLGPRPEILVIGLLIVLQVYAELTLR